MQTPVEERGRLQKLVNPEKLMGRTIRHQARILEDITKRGEHIPASQAIRDRVWGMGSAAKKHENQIPLRKNREGRVTQPTEIEGVHPSEFGVGTRSKGVRWVDKPLVQEVAMQGAPGGAGGVLHAANTVNEVVKTVQVYGRPAYTVTNHLQQLASGVATHGPKFLWYYAKAMRRVHGKELTHRMQDAMGMTTTQAMGAGRQFGTWSKIPGAKTLVRAQKGLIRLQTRATDVLPREAFLMARGAERGIVRTEQWDELLNPNLHDPALIRKRDAIIHEAREDAINFDSLTPGERNMATVAYFYPYLSRGSRWTGRFMLRRPATSAALYQGGATARRKGWSLGVGAPEWLEGYIPSRFGVSNPHPISTLSTPPQIAEPFLTQNPSGVFQKSLAEQFGTPAVQAAVSAKPPSEIVGQFFGATPVSQTARMLGSKSKWFGKQPKSFEAQKGVKGAAEIAGRFTFGGPYPRKLVSAEVQKQAIMQMTPKRAAQTKFKLASKALDAAAQSNALGENTHWLTDPQMKKQLDGMRQREISRASYKERYKHKKTVALDNFEADIQLLAKKGAISQSDARDWVKEARKIWKSGDKQKLYNANQSIGKTYFPRTGLKWAQKELRAKGVEITIPGVG